MSYHQQDTITKNNIIASGVLVWPGLKPMALAGIACQYLRPGPGYGFL